MKTINGDTEGFWEGSTGERETRFRLLIFNIFSLPRTFQGIALHLVLPCGTTFLRFLPAKRKNASFVVYTFQLTDVSSIRHICIRNTGVLQIGYRIRYLNAEICVFCISFGLLTTNFGCNAYYVPLNFGYIGETFGYFFGAQIGIPHKKRKPFKRTSTRLRGQGNNNSN